MKPNAYFRVFARLFLISAFFCLAFSETAAQTEAKWNPKKTWVFFVSLLEWQNSDDFKPFPKENRRDLVFLNTLKQRGVPVNQIVNLQDRQATTAKIHSSFRAFLNKVPADGWIFVYYSGHGYKVENRGIFLASYDAGIKSDVGWSAKSIPYWIGLYSKSRRAVVMVDSCYSGAVADAVKNLRTTVSYAVFASTLSNSASTGNWTFTESLIYGLRGDSFADRNRDGAVTFGEMAQNSYDDMLFAEEQLSESLFTGEFSEQSQMSVSKKVNASRLGERIEAFDGNEWFRAVITGARGGEYKVRYFGYEYEGDEYVSADRIRAAREARQFQIGEDVEVELDDEWLSARILKVVGGAHLVAFDDSGEDWNEWVASHKIRAKQNVKAPGYSAKNGN